MKNLRLHNDSIHTNFYQNQMINECARKKKKSRSHGMPELFIDIEELVYTGVVLNVVNTTKIYFPFSSVII